MKLFYALVYFFAAVGCGSLDPASVCEKAVEYGLMCELNEGRFSAEDVLECQTFYSLKPKVCMEIANDMFDCVISNQACSEEEVLASCMEEAVAVNVAKSTTCAD